MKDREQEKGSVIVCSESSESSTELVFEVGRVMAQTVESEKACVRERERE